MEARSESMKALQDASSPFARDPAGGASGDAVHRLHTDAADGSVGVASSSAKIASAFAMPIPPDEVFPLLELSASSTSRSVFVAALFRLYAMSLTRSPTRCSWRQN
jgi:hypothetical protein